MASNPERDRLRDSAPWRRWGPYLSERQWGTVREDYSRAGSAWEYLPFEHSHARAYRWGEDGLLGICDEQQRLCFALTLWNGQDPMLKERLFGLTNSQGNHGEDVKELYYYLDATPTHSYLQGLYKYPQRAFPYQRLREENARRSRNEPEFELLDTGLFDDDRYFDVFVEYAKAAPDDLLIRITAWNRGPEAAPLWLLPTLWFRNTWSWTQGASRPRIAIAHQNALVVQHDTLGSYYLHHEGDSTPLFCDNDSNLPRLFGVQGGSGFFKDAFHDWLIQHRHEAINPALTGTKAALCYSRHVEAGGSTTIRLRLSSACLEQPFNDFDALFSQRQQEADEFYAHLQHEIADPDTRNVQRQALAGMIWSKQFYDYDVPAWLRGDSAQPPPPLERRHGRNSDWLHLNNADVISMPDKWEYPWYASWDLAFHCVALALIDPEFAKEQLLLLAREWYMHPNGQLPAYEWALGDVNPPVHAWAANRVFQIDRKQRGDHGDLAFLERVFHKLLLNFTWWVNRKDAQGRNLFQGGFLGLDNIGVFDRNMRLPEGAILNQADGTSWMAMYCLNLLRMALHLAVHNPVYEDVATKFFEHFLYIAEAMTHIGGAGEPGRAGEAEASAPGVGLWNEDDQFYYDALSLSDGRTVQLKVRSMVGLIPLFAVETLEPELLHRLPGFARRLEWFLSHRPDLARLVSRWHEPGRGDLRLLSLLRGHRMKGLLRRMLDESEFLAPFGVRALSKAHEQQPYTFQALGQTLTVRYLPGESDAPMFGGNSNWRGPIWFPVNFLIIESLQKFHHYYGDDFLIECPTGSGRMLTIHQIASELSRRLNALFLRDSIGKRPVFGTCKKMQEDPHFRDHLLFFEYFHGDDGRGLGASHQTGWTGLVAKLLHPRREPVVACKQEKELLRE